MTKKAFAAGLLLVGIASTAALGADLTGTARVIDGDTIAIGQVHIRLAMIDAPEHDQICQDMNLQPYPCGAYATANLRALIGTGWVSCTPADHPDRYGRTVAVCRTVGGELNSAMVRSGWAIDYRKYDPRCRYCSDEAAAKAGRLGVWAGMFEAPDQWRMRRPIQLYNPLYNHDAPRY